MTDTVQIALISAAPPTIVAMAALIVSIKSKEAIREVHLSLNSRLDQLITATRQEAHAAGVNEEKKRTRS